MSIETLTQTIASLALRADKPSEEKGLKKAQNRSEIEEKLEEPYRYAHLLPVYPPDERYPPLEPFEHVDPGSRALSHPNPRSFLDSATRIDDLTPNLGTEIHGVNLAKLTSDERDQVALAVCTI